MHILAYTQDICFLAGCERSEQPALPEPLQTRSTKPPLQQATVFPVHAAGGGHLVPPLFYSLWGLFNPAERRWLTVF